jgi:hypothetical protein
LYENEDLLNVEAGGKRVSPLRSSLTALSRAGIKWRGIMGWLGKAWKIVITG